MIEINVLVPFERRKEILSMVSPTFEIITASDEMKRLTYFLISTTEEDATFLAIKYGKGVWKR